MLGEIFYDVIFLDQSQEGKSVRYELTIEAEGARLGTKKILSRQGKRLEVNIPAGVVTGSTVKLINALLVTDGHPGDILIRIKVKEEQVAAGSLKSTMGTLKKRF